MLRELLSNSWLSWIRLAPFTLFPMAFFVACGGGDDASSGDAGRNGSPPPVSAAVATDSGTATLQQISADTKSCLELVHAGNYVAAIDPCQRAVASGASADVDAALATAKSAIAEQGTTAALRAAASGLEGDSVGNSLKESAANAMGAADALEAEAAALESKAAGLEDAAGALEAEAGALEAEAAELEAEAGALEDAAGALPGVRGGLPQ